MKWIHTFHICGLLLYIFIITIFHTISWPFNITTNSWQGESGIKSTTGTDDWCRYTVVVKDSKAYLYFDTQLMGIANLNNKLSDLGTDLTCYLGKSFYDEDDYFKGQIASIAFYDCALSSAQVANIDDTVTIPDKDPDVELLHISLKVLPRIRHHRH